MITRAVALIFSLLALQAFAATHLYSQKIIVIDNLQVKEIIDGETIQLTTGARVRYIGVNVPAGKYFQAMEANRSLVAGKKIKLEFDVEKQDGYGRVLAYVFVDSVFVNAQLIKDGLAKFTPHPKNARYQHLLLEIENTARQSNSGIWGPQRKPKTKNDGLRGKLNFNIENTFVYVASDDERYHCANCPELGKHRIPMVLKNARLSYQACKVCRPIKEKIAVPATK